MDSDPPRSRVPVVIALVLGVVAGAVGWPLARRSSEQPERRPPSAPEDPYGEYSADVYGRGREENGVVQMERRLTVRWHVDPSGWFTVRWVDHRESPEVRGIRAGWWTSKDPHQGPWTFRVDGEDQGRDARRVSPLLDGTAGAIPAPSVLMFPHFDPRLRTFTDARTAVSRKLDLPDRMPVPADEVDPSLEPETPAPPR